MNRPVYNRALRSQRSTTASPHTAQKGSFRTNSNCSLFMMKRTDQRHHFVTTAGLNAKGTLTDSRKKHVIVQHLAIFWSNPQSFEPSRGQNSRIHHSVPLFP